MKDIDATTIVTTLHYLADKLRYFGYSYFSEAFITRLKREMKDVVQEAKHYHDLDRINPSKTFMTRMECRIKRKKLDNDHGLTWKDDDAEYACRIWDWWKPRIDEFPNHALALRLVVLAQLSSCSVECVFSRLKLICEICGDNIKEDMVNLWLMLQCNGDIGNLLQS